MNGNNILKRLKVNRETDLKTFLAEELKISKSKAKDLIDTKNVFVNGKRVWIATHKLKKGDLVELPFLNSFKSEDYKIEKNILYEDDFIIAIQKPPFYESNKSKKSVEYLLRDFKRDKNIEAIHRLDRETSGVLLFAKNKKVFYKFKDLWSKKRVKKIYLAISYGSADFKRKFINLPIDRKIAKSDVYVLDKNKEFTLFKIDLKTGRKHQIRIHLAKIGYPIIGDKIYGLKKLDDLRLKSINRQMLHAYEISFIHPFTKKKTAIKAPIYPDFKRAIKLLKLKLYQY